MRRDQGFFRDLADLPSEVKIVTLQTVTNTKIAVLNEEMDALDKANALYWKHEQHHSDTATVQHEFRQKRLGKIKDELAELRGQPAFP